MTSKTSSGSSPRKADRPHEWVDTPDHLKKVVKALSAEPLVGVDTESDSFHRYRERVCLIQISTSRADYIVDPLALTDLSTMRPLFADPKREWIMNGADYDVVCLKRDFDIHFAKIFDTVIAAQLLGYRATGLAAMLERHFGVKVSKTYQRDEWFRRPLTPGQIEYALTDTRYLIPLRDILRKELQKLGRLAWAEEECDALRAREWSREPFSPDDFWRIKGAKDLPRRAQVVLRELNVMRDRKAREGNRPPFKVISDAVLVAIAKAKPSRFDQVRKVQGMSPLMVRRLSEDILAAVRAGLDADENGLNPPPRGQRRRYDPGVGRRLDLLRSWRQKKASQLGLDAGVLSPLSCLQEVARANPRSQAAVLEIPDVSRWRAREFGAEWIAVLKDAE